MPHISKSHKALEEHKTFPKFYEILKEHKKFQNSSKKMTTRRFKTPKILEEDKAVQTSQDNRDKTFQNYIKHQRHISPTKQGEVSKSHYKGLQNTFQNCTH